MNIKINPGIDIRFIILFTLLLSYSLSIPSFNISVLAQVQDNDSLNMTEPVEIISSDNDTLTLDDASLITDKNIYSQGESVNISLLSVPSGATVNLTVISPGDIVYIALEEETRFYYFTETAEIGEYVTFANLSFENETTALSKEFEVIGPLPEIEEIYYGEEEFDLDNASLSVDKATYALGEPVRISLAAPPEVIDNFGMISPTGIFYVILPSASREYEFKPDSTGCYVINVLLSTDIDERFLTTEFEVIDLDLEIVFGEPEHGEIEEDEPVNWSQHIFIANRANRSVSNFSLDIPLPDDYSNLSSDAGFIIINSTILVDLAAGENVSFDISYQTSPVRLEVIEESIDIFDLIPPDAFDIGLYKQIGTGEEVFSPGLSLSLPIEVGARYVNVWHNSSAHYRNIPITIAVDEGERLFEVVDGMEMEISVNITDGIATWIIPELSDRMLTFMTARVEQNQGEAEIDKPVEWQLNVSGTIIQYKTPAPYKKESEPVFENGTWKKEIVICSNASVHYTNVTAFTNLSLENKSLPEKQEVDVKLFLIENGSRIDVTNDPAYNVSLLGGNGDSIIDEIEWNVPLLSSKTFEVECTYYALKITPVLTAKRKHFSLDEQPEFVLYITVDEFEGEKVGLATPGDKKALKTLATGKETVETFVYNYKGELTDIEPEIEDLSGGTFSIKLPEKRALRAGIYKLKVELVKDGITYTQEQEFQWGLVSLNTKKSIYKPGETAELIIVVLGRDGHAVSGANIRLNISNPDGELDVYSTDDGTINAGDEAGIYTADYLTGVEGDHTVDVASAVDGVEVSFNTYFLVRQDYEFDIIRTAQSKIDPTRQAMFDVKIDMESFTDANSVTIKEFVPASFDISTDAAGVILEGGTRTLTWNRDLIGNKTSVGYSYSVPHVWPHLYALGPAEIDYDGKTFTEARPWYVAVDPYVEGLWSESNSVSSDNLTLTSSGSAVGSGTGTWAYAYGNWAETPYEWWEFVMANSTRTGTISTVTLYLKHNQSGWESDNFSIQIWNGSGWLDVQSYTVGSGPPTSDTTDNWDVKALGIDTWTEINAAKVRIIGNGSAPPEDTVNWSVDTVELRIPAPDIRVVNVTFDYTEENKSSVSETGTGYHVKEGRNITVNATIANYGLLNATTDFNVSFFDCAGVYGDWSTWFGNYTYNVTEKGQLGNITTGYPYNTTYAIVYWDPSLVGTHNISAWADPENRLDEPAANVTNNNGSALINVSAWQKYWGNVSGGIALEDPAEQPVINWTWSNETGTGYIYVVNGDITVNWSALHGLGCDRDDTLNASGNDFSEADAALNMTPGVNNATGFANNNITQLFCGGNPNSATDTTYFIVDGTNITNVPIVNSTEMTNHTDTANANFTTGILWDYDSGNGTDYYDGSQDLIFIANVRPNELGLPGVTEAHNYEAGIPCALNATIGGNVDFYVEMRFG